MFLIIDNTKDLEHAKMTPKLLYFLENKGLEYKVLSRYHELVPFINNNGVIGIILSGGPICLSEKTELRNYSTNFTALIEFPKIPILGICFGYQVMCMAYGGIVDALSEPVIGNERISVIPNSLLMTQVDKTIDVFQHHIDYVKEIPLNFTITSLNPNGRVEAIENVSKLRYGVQFHPENSPNGYLILDQFIKICKDNASFLNNDSFRTKK
jgi:GMP synthase (glutamine-hydrolysing)